MGAGGVKNFSQGIFDGAPSTASSSYVLHLLLSIHLKYGSQFESHISVKTL